MLKQGLFLSILVAAVAIGIYYKYFIFPQSPIVALKDGKVQGIIQVARDGREYYSFLGIPYAKPPVGELRFEPPQPAAPWKGIHDASHYRSQCMQMEFFMSNGVVSGSEDCLYINVFVPKFTQNTQPKTLLPVLTYIHGGIFHVGGTKGAGAGYFMGAGENIILVTLSYRLGALGFLNSGDAVIRGNMGLKDQNLALRWINKNIKMFGGDPSKVTIFGESAGGASVAHHVLSPMSKGLVYKAIHQSGSGVNYWALFRNVKAQSQQFAKKFNCPVEDSKKMAKCLKNVDGKTLVAGHSDLLPFVKPKIVFFAPSIEAVKDENAFITEEPEELLKSGRFNKIQLLTGSNSAEGLLLSAGMSKNQEVLNEANDNWKNWIPLALHYDGTKSPDAALKIRKFYFGSEDKPINDSKLLEKFTNMYGDRYFSVPASQSALLTSKHVPTYAYYYDHRGGLSVGAIMSYTEGRQGLLKFFINMVVDRIQTFIQANILGQEVHHWGCSHGDEIGMLFSGFPFELFFNKTGDTQMSKDMVKLWIDFATDKKPLAFRNVQFPPVSPTGPLKFVRISKNPAVIKEPFEDRRKFWESLNIPNE